MIFVATFAQWLKVQQGRQDDVGQFARMWEAMEGKPRLSSPTSIWRYLEGYAEKDQMRPFYDAALAEYQNGPRLGGEPGQDATVTPIRPDQPPAPPAPVAEIYKPPAMQDPRRMPPAPAWQPKSDPARALTDLGSINKAFTEIHGFMTGLAAVLGITDGPDPGGRWMELYARLQSARLNVGDGTEAAVVLDTVIGWMDDADTIAEDVEVPSEPLRYDWGHIYQATDWTPEAGAQ